jgi:flavin reductase (DIM6/NTAB) family NADH-FMN oxidoreductase RutF/DNA-binding IclR family transcriptional regulator
VTQQAERPSIDLPATTTAVSPDHYRRVLGHLPTGVTVITAIGPDDSPIGMSVGSFTSVSLEPPLVAFYPDRTSTTFPGIRAASSFCVNVLADDQEWICRQMARKGAAKFEGVGWTSAPSGAPILDGCVAWIDCVIDRIADAGDHFLVFGRVTDLQVAAPSMPLLFFQGGYGRFTTASLAMPARAGIGDRLRGVDRARPEMERLSETTGAGCLAVIEGDQDDMIVAASTRESRRGVAPTRVGQRLPLAPPLGGLFVAWAPPEQQKAWLTQAVDDGRRAMLEEGLGRIRARGFSLGLDSSVQAALELALTRLEADPGLDGTVRRLLAEVTADSEPEQLDRVQPVRQLAAPVFGPAGSVVMYLMLFGLPAPMDPETLTRLSGELLAATRRVSEALASAPPAQA